MMDWMKLNEFQLGALDLPAQGGLFIEGPAGTGKTTAALARLERIFENNPHESILVWVPQRTLASRYFDLIQSNKRHHSGEVSVLTLGGLSRRLVDLFWPVIAEQAGFERPDQPPIFLTLETAQYYMAEQVRPLLDDGFFSSITIEPHRLYSQILDNLNKAALIGFEYQEISQRLSEAWTGDETQLRVYSEAQECAQRFRHACLQNNLLDFSLQVDVFMRHLWPLPICRDYLASRVQNLIADNIEEDTPAAHDVLGDLSEAAKTHLFIFDTDGGYRRFLGADPERAYLLKNHCAGSYSFEQPIHPNPTLISFAAQITSRLAGSASPEPLQRGFKDSVRVIYQRYQPQLIDWVADEISRLIGEEGVPPENIAVLSPFLSDTLRFSLNYACEQRGIPVRSHRPSRALRDEPATRSLLTLMRLAHPHWTGRLSREDIAEMLMTIIEDMDAVRASLMSEVLFRPKLEGIPLQPFAQLSPEMKGRMTFSLGERFDQLLDWLKIYAQLNPVAPDYFLSRVFGEVLAQPGFGFHTDLDGGQVAASLIESIGKFHQVIDPGHAMPADELGQTYLKLVQEGLVAAQYLHRWRTPVEPAVLMAPAYSYLVSNRMVDIQFWLNIGGRGWWERLYQPLTHPFVLSRGWERGRPWLDQDEHLARQGALLTLTQGLLRRCREKVYLGLSELGEGGYEQHGPLLKVIHRIMLEESQFEANNDL
jgi:hypothetical protein